MARAAAGPERSSFMNNTTCVDIPQTDTSWFYMRIYILPSEIRHQLPLGAIDSWEVFKSFDQARLCRIVSDLKSVFSVYSLETSALIIPAVV